jgi:hypothetical protein
MKHSPHEKFFWLKDAALLDRIARGAKSFPARTSKSKAEQYRKIEQSFDKANTILTALGRREVSIDELDTGKNKAGELTFGSLRLSARKVALARIGATGNTDDRLVSYAMNEGIVTKADVTLTKKNRKRRLAFDAEKISIVARFLVEFWCGEKGIYGCKRQAEIFFMPPLAFFSNGALARFCAFALGKKQSESATSITAIRKSVWRLGLKRATCPKIRDVKIIGDEICFLP